MESVFARLQNVFQQVFDDDELEVQPTTTAKDVEGWDSLQHVTLILHVERAFGVKFTSKQVAKLNSVGELAELIEQLLKQKSQ